MKLGVYVLPGDMLIAKFGTLTHHNQVLVRLVVDSVPEHYLLMACSEGTSVIDFDTRDHEPVRETHVDYWHGLGWEVVRQ